MKSTVTANMPPPSHISKYSPFHSPRRVLWYVDALRIQHCYHRPLNLLGYFCGDEINSGLEGCKTIKDEGSLQDIYNQTSGMKKSCLRANMTREVHIVRYYPRMWRWPAATSKSHFEGTQSIRIFKQDKFETNDTCKPYI